MSGTIKYAWDEINEYYHSSRDITVDDCAKKFGFCRSSWCKAVQRGSVTAKNRLEYGKVCSGCGTSDQERFTPKSSTYCRKCNSAYLKKHYKDNKPAYVKRNRASVRKIREYLNDLKRHGKCCQCPEDNDACLDFHHIGSTQKNFSIAQFSSKTHSLSKVKEEVGKCILVCSNCHRKIHAD